MIIAHKLDWPKILTQSNAIFLDAEPDTVASVHYKP